MPRWNEEDKAKLRLVYKKEVGRLYLKDHFPARNVGAIKEQARRMGLARKIALSSPRPKLLSPVEAAYLAGLILADGHIRGGKGHYIGFVNTELAIIESFAAMFSNCRIRVYPIRGASFKSKKKYQCTICSVEGMRETLIQILPFLVGKKLDTAKRFLDAHPYEGDMQAPALNE